MCNIIDTSILVLLFQLLIGIFIQLLIYKIIGYITINFFRINCNVMMQTVIGFLLSFSAFGFITSFSKLFKIHFATMSYLCLLFLGTIIILQYIIIKKRKQTIIFKFIENKEDYCFCIILSLLQICIMIWTVDNSKLDYVSNIVCNMSVLIDNNGIIDSFGEINQSFSNFDLYIAEICKISNINPWIMYVVSMSMLKIFFYTCIVYCTGEVLFENKEKKYAFLIVSLIVGIVFYYGGTEISATYNSVIGECLYGNTSSTDIYIRVIIIPMIIYGIIDYFNSDRKKDILLIIIMIASSCFSYKSAFLSILIVVVFLFSDFAYNHDIKKIFNLGIKLCIIPFIFVIPIIRNIEITYFLYFKDVYKELWQYNFIPIIVTLLLVMYSLFCKDLEISKIRKSIIIPSLIYFAVFMNPMVTKMTGKFVGIMNLQSVVWWGIPYTYIISALLLCAYMEIQNYLLGELLVITLILGNIFCGDFWGVHLQLDNYRVRENIEHFMSNNDVLFLNSTAKRILNRIKEYNNDINENIILYTPYNLLYSISIYDKSIEFPYRDSCYEIHNSMTREMVKELYYEGKISFLEAYGSFDGLLEQDELIIELINSNVNYAVIENFDNKDLSYNVVEIAQIDKYSILKINH